MEQAQFFPSYPLPVDPAGKALTRRAIDFALFPVVPHRTDSRFHEFLNDWRGEERQIANTVFPGSIYLVINGPLYRCTRAQECPSGRSEEHTSALHSLIRIPYAVFCL